MHELSLLIGGQAGYGIDRSGTIIGRLLNRMGYHIYIYREYPSLIRGGHTFSIIRASQDRIAAHKNTIDVLIALNPETLELHKNKLIKNGICIYDSEQTKQILGSCCLNLPLTRFVKEENAPDIMRNTCAIGAFAKTVGIEFAILEEVLKKELPRATDLNLKVARHGYEEAREFKKITELKQGNLPILSGNQGIALGLLKGGLNAYIAYPMTPSSPILHYLASNANDINIDVIQPESEISVALMALGYIYAGKKAAVGTSGGGFCLMTESLSMAGMAELPIVIILGQRPGPSTGLPTYSAQTELHFALHAGQGEFHRFVVAPGDAEEALFWSAICMNISWKYQIPGIILSDKNMGESVFNFDMKILENLPENMSFSSWTGESTYKRYLFTETGISPLIFPPVKNETVKINSYEHDENGVTTEDPNQTTQMQDKRLRKNQFLLQELENMNTVNTYQAQDDESTALLCWGSNKGVCVEIGKKLGIGVIQPVVLNPFPVKQFQQAVSKVKKLISVENNATGQLADLVKNNGFNVYKKVLKYDGRAFSLEELEEKIKGAIS